MVSGSGGNVRALVKGGWGFTSFDSLEDLHAVVLLKKAHPTREEIIQHLDDNLCRCGSHTRIVDAILEAAGSLDFPVLFPVHPRTRSVLQTSGVEITGKVLPVPPLGYLEMLAIEKHARKILTDSGGVQKEAFYLQVQCVTLREETEWPETVQLGANCMAGSVPQTIAEAVHSDRKVSWTKKTPYGDGKAAERIVNELLASQGSLS
jgi:UDP-N-acetylglucosamine 2-epimerase